MGVVCWFEHAQFDFNALDTNLFATLELYFEPHSYRHVHYHTLYNWSHSWLYSDLGISAKVQLSFDICYIIESARGLAVLLCRSRLPESSFLPHSIENGQLLQYGHAYQLSVCANVKTMDARACVLPRTAERCENGNVLTSKRSCNGTER